MGSIYSPPQWPAAFGRALGYLEHGVFRSPDDHTLRRSPQPRFVRRKAWPADHRLTLRPVGDTPYFLLGYMTPEGEMFNPWVPQYEDLLARDWEEA